MLIREAVRGESDELSRLAMRSKAYWGYDDVFLAACRRDLTITEKMLSCRPTFVAVDAEGTIRGFSQVILSRPAAVLDYLYIDPSWMGRGLGSALFSKATAAARHYGATRLQWDADPHAVDFYRRQGAFLNGRAESTSVPGRFLPSMAISLTETHARRVEETT